MNLESNLHIGIRRLSRTAYIVTCVAIVLLCGANFFNFFLDHGLRLALIAVGLIAPCLFLLSLYLYESRILAGKGDSRFLLKSIFAVLALFLPTVILIFRFQLFSVDDTLWLKFVAFLPLILFLLDWGKEIIVKRVSSFFAPITHHIKYVMWESWEKSDCELMPKTNWPEQRKTQFRSGKGLRLFQETLTCPVVDSAAVAAKCSAIWKPGAKISIIDVGGGDGRFTSRLLKAFKYDNLKVQDLMMVDPVEWRSDYTAALGTGHGIDLNFKTVSLLEAAVENDYDLVLASHSLYADLDGSKTIQSVEDAVKRLVSWRKTNGVVVVILASRSSAALRFKDQAFKMLFGESITELVAEDLAGVMAGYGAEPEYLDNLMDLSIPLADWDNGKTETLSEWLNYFLRFPVSQNHTILHSLVNELKLWVQPFNSLSQDEQSRFKKLGLDFKRTALVLPHKVVLWVVKSKAA